MSESLKLSKPGSLQTWLDYLHSLNPCHIELGFERVKKVLYRLNLDFSNTCIVEVAGTNGKGSTSALIAAILKNLGVKTGLYTSPHLWHFNERVVIDGQNAKSELLADAFDTVHKAAIKEPEIPLTYFEYTTLAAFVSFYKENVGAMVLEIGLGGRLDAVNSLDADVSIITSIGLDHTKILGDTIEKIAFEKAGIIKNNAVCITGILDKSAEDEIISICKERNATLYVQNRDFATSFDDKTHYKDKLLAKEMVLSYPKVPECCAAAAIKCVEVLVSKFKDKLKGLNTSLTEEILNNALEHTSLPGRMQLIEKNPNIYIDVAHNPPAALHLAQVLKARAIKGKRYAVIGMLADKDIESVLKIVVPVFDEFYVTSLPTERGESYERLSHDLMALGVKSENIHCFDKASLAALSCKKQAKVDDEIIIMGSFVTVSQACSSDCKLNEE